VRTAFFADSILHGAPLLYNIGSDYDFLV